MRQVYVRTFVSPVYMIVCPNSLSFIDIRTYIQTNMFQHFLLLVCIYMASSKWTLLNICTFTRPGVTWIAPSDVLTVSFICKLHDSDWSVASCAASNSAPSLPFSNQLIIFVFNVSNLVPRFLPLNMWSTDKLSYRNPLWLSFWVLAPLLSKFFSQYLVLGLYALLHTFCDAMIDNLRDLNE